VPAWFAAEKQRAASAAALTAAAAPRGQLRITDIFQPAHLTPTQQQHQQQVRQRQQLLLLLSWLKFSNKQCVTSGSFWTILWP
jgi:hypothetical protein